MGTERGVVNLCIDTSFPEQKKTSVARLGKAHRGGKAMEKEKLSAQHLGVTLGNDFITKLFLPGPSKVEES